MAVKTRGKKIKIPPKIPNLRRNNLKSKKYKKKKIYKSNNKVVKRQLKTKHIKKAPKSNSKPKESKAVKKYQKQGKAKVSIQTESNNKKSLNTNQILSSRSLRSQSSCRRVRRSSEDPFVTSLLASVMLKCQKAKMILALRKKDISKQPVQPKVLKIQAKSQSKVEAKSTSKPQLQIDPKLIPYLPKKINKMPAAKPTKNPQIKNQTKYPSIKLQQTKDSQKAIQNSKEIDSESKLKIVCKNPPKFQIFSPMLTINQIQEQRRRQRLPKRYFLLNMTKKDGNWILNISNGVKMRLVLIRPNIIQCCCVDYRLQRTVCGEIEFIIKKILRNQQLNFHLIRHRCEIDELLFDKIELQLCQMLSFHLDPKQQTLPKELESLCIICFNILQDNFSSIEKCGYCQQQFHANCLRLALNQIVACPKCKKFTVEVKEQITEPIQKLQQVCI